MVGKSWSPGKTVAVVAATAALFAIPIMMTRRTRQSYRSAEHLVRSLIQEDFPSGNIALEQKLSQYHCDTFELDGLCDRINDTGWRNVFVQHRDIQQCVTIRDLVNLVARSTH